MTEAFRSQIIQAVDCLKPVVEDVAKSLYHNPELGLQEVYAVSKLTEILESHGFNIERETAGMPTAFKAQSGSRGPNIAFMAEYDALPEIGHGCGHNLIAAGACRGLAINNVLPPDKAKVT